MLEINEPAGEHKIIMTAKEFTEEYVKWNRFLVPEDIMNIPCQCEYCNSEVDRTYVNCPNCGAPLKKNWNPAKQWFYNGIPVELIP